jgi:hypothetical protein
VNEKQAPNEKLWKIGLVEKSHEIIPIRLPVLSKFYTIKL